MLRFRTLRFCLSKLFPKIIFKQILRDSWESLEFWDFGPGARSPRTGLTHHNKDEEISFELFEVLCSVLGSVAAWGAIIFPMTGSWLLMTALWEVHPLFPLLAALTTCILSITPQHQPHEQNS